MEGEAVDIAAGSFACVAETTGSRGGTMADMKWRLEETKRRRPASRDCMLPAGSRPLPPVLLHGPARGCTRGPARVVRVPALGHGGTRTAARQHDWGAPCPAWLLHGALRGGLSSKTAGMQPCGFHVGGKGRPAKGGQTRRLALVATPQPHIHMGMDGGETHAAAVHEPQRRPPHAPQPQAGDHTGDGKTASPVRGGATTDSVRSFWTRDPGVKTRRVVPAAEPERLSAGARLGARSPLSKGHGAHRRSRACRHRRVTFGHGKGRDSRSPPSSRAAKSSCTGDCEPASPGATHRNTTARVPPFPRAPLTSSRDQCRDKQGQECDRGSARSCIPLQPPLRGTCRFGSAPRDAICRLAPLVRVAETRQHDMNDITVIGEHSNTAPGCLHAPLCLQIRTGAWA